MEKASIANMPVTNTNASSVNKDRLGIGSKEDSTFVPMILWSEFSNQVFPDIQWRVKNLIPIEGFVLLVSPSGEKKSWLALELARCVAAGIPFGQTKIFETIKGKVLYIDAEMSKRELQRRCKQLGFDDQVMEDVFLMSADKLNLNEDKIVKELGRLVLNHGISLIVIDTFRAIAGGIKEEKAEEIRTFYNRFKPFKNLGVACLFLDHSRKPNHFEGTKPKKDQVFASQDKVANCEVLLMLQKYQETENLVVYQNKNRLAQEIKPFVLNFYDEVDDVGKKKTLIVYEGELEEEKVKREQAKTLILECLQGKGMSQEELVEFCRGYDVGDKNTRVALKELTNLGTIIKSKDGRKNFYSIKKDENEVNNFETEPFDFADREYEADRESANG